MRSTVSIVSAAITAFVLALTAGTVYAYRSLTAESKVSIQQPGPVSSSLQLVQISTPTEAASLSPQDAASVAAKFLNRTDLYSAELAEYQGSQAYKITFSSGDVVYVGMNGVVMGSETPPAPIVVTSSGGGGHYGGGGEGHSGGGESESEHEDDGH